MILCSIITLLMFCCLTAHAANSMIELQDNHSDRYVVNEGDTSWGISAKFLKDLWRWPHLWEINKPSINSKRIKLPNERIGLLIVLSAFERISYA